MRFPRRVARKSGAWVCLLLGLLCAAEIAIGIEFYVRSHPMNAEVISRRDRGLFSKRGRTDLQIRLTDPNGQIRVEELRCHWQSPPELPVVAIRQAETGFRRLAIDDPWEIFGGTLTFCVLAAGITLMIGLMVLFGRLRGLFGRNER